MKKLFILSVFYFIFASSFAGLKDADKKCTEKFEGRTLYVGEKGGCYYITIKDKKRVKNYVDRSLCKGCI
jgi:hypothetical protein